MDNLQIRPHERNPNLWWVSSRGDDVAYITRPGNGYLAWTTGKAMPGQADSSASASTASTRRWKR
jgi:hypothetical protein